MIPGSVNVVKEKSVIVNENRSKSRIIKEGPQFFQINGPAKMKKAKEIPTIKLQAKPY